MVSVRMAPPNSSADQQADHGDHRDQRVAQRVQADHARGRQALGAGGADIVLAQHLEHGRAGLAGDDRERHGAEHDRGQDQVATAAERKAPFSSLSRLSISMKPVTGSTK